MLYFIWYLLCLVFKRKMFKECLTYILICVFLVKFIRDAESRNELFLAFNFSLLFGYYIGNCIVSSLLYKATKKINTEVQIVIKNYNATRTTTTSAPSKKFIHSKKAREKEIWVVWTWFNDLDRRLKVWTCYWRYRFTFFPNENYKLWYYT